MQIKKREHEKNGKKERARDRKTAPEKREWESVRTSGKKSRRLAMLPDLLVFGPASIRQLCCAPSFTSHSLFLLTQSSHFLSHTTLIYFGLCAFASFPRQTLFCLFRWSILRHRTQSHTSMQSYTLPYVCTGVYRHRCVYVCVMYFCILLTRYFAKSIETWQKYTNESGEPGTVYKCVWVCAVLYLFCNFSIEFGWTENFPAYS